MANWWDNAPVVKDTDKAPVPTGKNWWDKAPVVTGKEPHADRAEPSAKPLPNSEMYSGDTMEEALVRQKSYEEDAQTKEDSLGRKTYGGAVIPKPENRFSFGRIMDLMTPIGIGHAVGSGIGNMIEGKSVYPEADVSLQQQGVGNLVDLGKNLGSTALAAGSWLMDGASKAVGGSDVIPETLNSAAETLDSSFGDQVPGGAMDELYKEGQQVAAGAIAGGGAGSAATRGLGTLGKTVGKGLGAEIGMGSAVDPNSETLVTGDNAMLPLLEAFSTDEKGNYSEELGRKRLNLIAEGLTLGLGLEKTAKGAAFLSKFFWDVAGTPTAKLISDSKVKEDMVREFADQVGRVDNHTTNEQQYQIRKTIADKVRENAYKWFHPETEGIDPVVLKRDTMSTLEHGDFNKDDAAYIRAGMLAKESPKLRETLRQPAQKLDKMYDQTERLFGGQKAMDDSVKSIQDSGMSEVNQARQAVTQGEQAIKDAEGGIETLLREDLTFGKMVQDAEKQGVKLDVYKEMDNSVRQIGQNIGEADETMRKVREQKFNDIPGTAKVYDQDFNTAVEKYKDLLPKELLQEMKETGGNYKRLLEFSNFKLKKLAETYAGQKEFTDAKSIRELRRTIREDFVDSLVAKSPKSTADKAAEAGRYHKEEYQPNFQQSVGEDLQKIRRNNFGKPDNTDKETLEYVKGILDNPNAEKYTERMKSILARPEGKESSRLMTDYWMGKTAGEVQIALGKGKLSDLDVGNFEKTLRSAVRYMEPEDIKRSEAFLSNLKNKKKTVPELKEDLKKFEQNAKSEEQRIFQHELSDFFERGSQRPVDNSNKVFDSIFRKNSPKKVEELMERDFTGQGGMKTAFTNYLRKNLLDKDGKINTEFYAKMRKEGNVDPEEKIMEIGKKVFGEDSPLLGAMAALQDEAGGLASRQTRAGFPIPDASRVAKDAREGTNLVITMWFGALNRMGARVRSATGKAITKLDRGTVATQIMDEMLSDPEGFEKTLRKVMQEDRTKVPKSVKDLIWKSGIRSGYFVAGDDTERQKFDQAVDAEAFNNSVKNSTKK